MKTIMPERLPWQHLCASCGKLGPGTHWHGYDRLGKQKRYCDVDCCPTHSTDDEFGEVWG